MSKNSQIASSENESNADLSFSQDDLPKDETKASSLFSSQSTSENDLNNEKTAFQDDFPKDETEASSLFGSQSISENDINIDKSSCQDNLQKNEIETQSISSFRSTSENNLNNDQTANKDDLTQNKTENQPIPDSQSTPENNLNKDQAAQQDDLPKDDAEASSLFGSQNAKEDDINNDQISTQNEFQKDENEASSLFGGQSTIENESNNDQIANQNENEVSSLFGGQSEPENDLTENKGEIEKQSLSENDSNKKQETSQDDFTKDENGAASLFGSQPIPGDDHEKDQDENGASSLFGWQATPEVDVNKGQTENQDDFSKDENGASSLFGSQENDQATNQDENGASSLFGSQEKDQSVNQDDNEAASLFGSQITNENDRASNQDENEAASLFGSQSSAENDLNGDQTENKDDLQKDESVQSLFGGNIDLSSTSSLIGAELLCQPQLQPQQQPVNQPQTAKQPQQYVPNQPQPHLRNQPQQPLQPQYQPQSPLQGQFQQPYQPQQYQQQQPYQPQQLPNQFQQPQPFPPQPQPQPYMPNQYQPQYSQPPQPFMQQNQPPSQFSSPYMPQQSAAPNVYTQPQNPSVFVPDNSLNNLPPPAASLNNRQPVPPSQPPNQRFYIPGAGQSSSPSPYVPGYNSGVNSAPQSPYVPGMPAGNQPQSSFYQPRVSQQPQQPPPPPPMQQQPPPPQQPPMQQQAQPKPNMPFYIPGMNAIQQQQQMQQQNILQPAIFTPSMNQQSSDAAIGGTAPPQASKFVPPPPPSAKIISPPPPALPPHSLQHRHPLQEEPPVPTGQINMPKFQIPKVLEQPEKPKVQVFNPGAKEEPKNNQNMPPSIQPATSSSFRQPPQMPGFKVPPQMPSSIQQAPKNFPPSSSAAPPPTTSTDESPFKKPASFSMPKFTQPVPVSVPGSTEPESNKEGDDKPASEPPKAAPFAAPPPFQAFKPPPSMPSFAMPASVSNDSLKSDESSEQTQPNIPSNFKPPPTVPMAHSLSKDDMKAPPPTSLPTTPNSSSMSNFKQPPAMPKFSQPTPPPISKPTFQMPVGIPISADASSPSNEKKFAAPPMMPSFQQPIGIPTQGIPRSQTAEPISSSSNFMMTKANIIAPPAIPQVIRSVSQPVDVAHSSIPFFTKRKPLTAFGFGGLFVHVPSTLPSSSSTSFKNDSSTTKGSVPSSSSSPSISSHAASDSSTVEISRINNLYKNLSIIDQLSSFNRGTTPAEIQHFINKRIASSSTIEDQLLWAAVHVRIQHGSTIKVGIFNQNAKLMGTPEYILLQLLSQKNGGAGIGINSITSPVNYKSSDIDPKLVTQLQKIMIENGEREGLEFCLKNKMWPFAFIISSSLSPIDQQRVSKEFINSTISPSPLYNILSAISGQQRDLGDETWQERLSTILQHYTQNANKTLVEFATYLQSKLNNLPAAHICFILSSKQLESPPSDFSLVGTDWKHPTINSVQMSQFMSSDTVTVEFYPIALYYTMALIDFGFIDLAKSNNQKLKARFKKENIMPFFIVSKPLQKKLKHAIPRNLQGGLVKNLMSVVDKALTNLVHGEDETEKDQFLSPKLPEQVKLMKSDDHDPNKIGNTDSSSEISSTNSSEKEFKAIPSTPPNVPHFSFASPPPMTKIPTPVIPPNPLQEQAPAINKSGALPPPPKPAAPQRSFDEYQQPSYSNDYTDTNSNKDTFGMAEDDFYGSHAPSHDLSSQQSQPAPTPGEPQQEQQQQEKPQQELHLGPPEKLVPKDEEKKQGGGWFKGIFSKLNPFSHSTDVDLNLHDGGEMVWNGHRYVMKGHENDEPEQRPPPPPPMAVNKAPPQTPPSGGSPPPPGMGGPPPPTNADGNTGSTRRSRVSNRYVATF